MDEGRKQKNTPAWVKFILGLWCEDPRELITTPCPNCGGNVYRRGGSPISEAIDVLKCDSCGWCKLTCGRNCGSYLNIVRSNAYGEAWYKCVSCGWTGSDIIFRGDSDGRSMADDGSGSIHTTTQPVGAMRSKSDKECVALFIFDSDRITHDVSNAYGSYA